MAISNTERLAEEAMDRMVRQSEWAQDMVAGETPGVMASVVQDNRQSVHYPSKSREPGLPEYRGPRTDGPACPVAHARYLEGRRIRGEI
jgi:hypothetical protein